MTLPVGTISMSQVNTELGLSSTATISLNQANVRALAEVRHFAIWFGVARKTHRHADTTTPAGHHSSTERDP